MAGSKLRLFFRILYRCVYILLYIVLFALLLVTPADAIERSISNRQRYNIWILAIGYAVTIFIVCFIYAMRLYVNKTALASIPKAWIPIEKSDVKRAVYKMIVVGLNRSAAIALEARPRVQDDETDEAQGQEHAPDQPPVKVGLRKKRTAAEELGVALPPHRAVWGDIEHPGWASPNSADLPNLQYSTVLAELPNLIEAKALTLAPPDLASRSDPPVLDPEAVALLQRPPNLGLRDYMDHLASLGVLSLDAVVMDFLAQYEHARFSTRPLSNQRFRELMHLFAEVLRDMAPLDLDALDPLGGEEDSLAPSESDIDNDAPRGTNSSTPQSNLSRPVTASSQGSVRRPGGTSSANTRQQYRTAPNTPRSRRNDVAALSRQSSGNSFAQTRRTYPVSQPSSASLRSGTSDGSVIRLATGDDEGLPYVLSLKDTAGT